MALFDIFGDLTRQTKKNSLKQHLAYNENIGKMVSAGPIKPNEPVKSVKKGETKKSFLSNAGKALQGTPKAVFTPRSKNVMPIYNDETDTVENDCTFEDFVEIEFNKPVYLNDNYHKDALDYLPMPNLQITKHIDPVINPPPTFSRFSMDCSYQDDVSTSPVNISWDVPNITDKALELPDLSIEYMSDESLGELSE